MRLSKVYETEDAVLKSTGLTLSVRAGPGDVFDVVTKKAAYTTWGEALRVIRGNLWGPTVGEITKDQRRLDANT